MRLDKYDGSGFDRGSVGAAEIIWFGLSGLLFSSSLPGSKWRVFLLRVFGATVGKGVVIKPSVRIKFPWRLKIGNYSWIGESVWIDNLDQVTIGSHCCISQGAYFCTGSHNWKKEKFDLITKPICLDDEVWVGAMTRIGPGVSFGRGSVLVLGSTATSALAPFTIASGLPAVAIGIREKSE